MRFVVSAAVAALAVSAAPAEAAFFVRGQIGESTITGFNTGDNFTAMFTTFNGPGTLLFDNLNRFLSFEGTFVRTFNAGVESFSFEGGGATFAVSIPLNGRGNGSLTTSEGSLMLNNVSVPEPATWAMMIAGFGLVGGAMRRKATQAALA